MGTPALGDTHVEPGWVRQAMQLYKVKRGEVTYTAELCPIYTKSESK